MVIVESSRDHTSGIRVRNEELVTARDAMRGLNQMVERLQAGEVEKFVLMRRGKMVATVQVVTDE